MNTQKFRLLVTWNVVLTVLLFIALGFVAVSVQAANDPPIKMFSASLDHAVAGTGSGRTSDLTINSTGYQTILSVPVNLTGQTHTHHCLALGSANVKNPAGGGNTGYRYDFSMKQDAAVTAFSKMTLEMSDNPSHDDPNVLPVTTNRFWSPVNSAAHTFDFVARKQLAENPNLVIDNAFMTVICVKKLQESAGAFEEPAAEEMAPEDIMPNDK